MPKVAIVGAGNVGGFTATRIAQENLAEVVLIDIVKGLAEGKALDIEDARWLLEYQNGCAGTDDFSQLAGAAIIVVTAGFARKPGETRQDLLNKNSRLIKDISLKVKQYAPDSIVIVVTNPVDTLTYYLYKTTGLDKRRVIGLGLSLDAARFANLISRKINCPVSDIKPMVIASHNEKMLPMARFTMVKGRPLSELLDEADIAELVRATRSRGAQIVSALGSGSAYVAPSAAVLRMVKAILGDAKEDALASVVLDGEYGLKDICFGTPVIIGKSGIEKVITLNLSAAESQEYLAAAKEIKQCLTLG
ncbi:MAG: malate dehydrogenase [Candidatus Omnitrophota bacterium]